MNKIAALQDRQLGAVAANIVHQIGDALYAALPADVAREHFVQARQATNDLATDFAKRLISGYVEEASTGSPSPSVDRPQLVGSIEDFVARRTPGFSRGGERIKSAVVVSTATGLCACPLDR